MISMVWPSGSSKQAPRPSKRSLTLSGSAGPGSAQEVTPAASMRATVASNRSSGTGNA